MQRNLTDRLVEFGLLAIVVVAPTQYSFAVAKGIHLSVVDPLIWLTFLAWLVGAFRTGELKQLIAPLFFPALLVILAALSVLKTAHVLRSLSDIVQLAEYFIAGLLLFLSATRSAGTLKKVIFAFLAVTTLVISIGLVQYFAPGTPDFLVRSTFSNRNVYGGFLALTLPLMFGLMLGGTSIRNRIWFLLVILAGLVSMLAGGAFIAIATSFSAIAMLKGWKTFAVLAGVLLLGVILIMPALPRHNIGALRKSVEAFNDDGEVSRRYAEWQAAISMTKDKPLAGVGAGNYQANIGMFYGLLPIVGGTAAEADTQNLYLVLSSSIGLPGLLAFLGLLLFSTARALEGWFSSKDTLTKGMYLGTFGSLIAFAVCSVWSPLLVRGIGVPLALVMALAIGRAGKGVTDVHEEM